MGPGFDVGIGGGPGIPPRFPGGGGRRKSMEDRRRRMNDRRREMRDDRNRERRERMERDRREFEKRRPRRPGREKPPERRPIEGRKPPWKGRKPPWMDEKPPFFEGPLPGPGRRPFPPKNRPGINPPRDDQFPPRGGTPDRPIPWLPPRGKPRWGINPPPEDKPRWGLFPIPGRDRPGINPPRSDFDVGLPGPPGFYDIQRRKQNTKWKLRKESDRQSLKGDDIGPEFLEKNLSKYAQFLNILKGIKGGR